MKYDTLALPERPTREQANERFTTCPICISFVDDLDDVEIDGIRYYAYVCTNCGRRVLVEIEGQELDEHGDGVAQLIEVEE